MTKTKKEDSEEEAGESTSSEEVITDIITTDRFKEDGVSKARRAYLNGDKVVKEVVENE